MNGASNDSEESQSRTGKQSNIKYKRWVFTTNNPGDYVPVFNNSTMAYMVFQLEQGKQGTPHYQGYVRYHNKRRLTQMKKDFFPGTHFEGARGSEQECRDYCTKDDTRLKEPVEHGIFKPDEGKQGARHDLDDIADMCKNGKTIKEIAISHPSDFIRYHQGIVALHQQLQPTPPAVRSIKILVLWGPTGVGKSYRMATQCPDAFKVHPGRSPWDGYQNQMMIWFDEFDPEQWDIYLMNSLLDQYQFELNCRYHNKYANWQQVCICSNQDPMQWYPNAVPAARDALRRRLGSGCRYVTSREQDISQSPPTPDFSYLTQ